MVRNRIFLFAFAFAAALLFAAVGFAQEDPVGLAAAPEPVASNMAHASICPPVDVAVADAPLDEGDALLLTWKPCPKKNVPTAEHYVVYRAEKAGSSVTPFVPIAEFGAGENLVEKKVRKDTFEKVYSYRDGGLSQETSYLYRVAARAGGKFAYGFSFSRGKLAVDLGPISPERQIIPFKKRGELGGDLAVSPPTEVSAKDKPNDAGNAIIVDWKPPAGAGGILGLNYRVYRSTEAEGDYKFIGSAGGDRTRYVDSTHKDAKERKTYYYLVAASNPLGTRLAVSGSTNGAKAKVQYINWATWNFFFFAFVISIFIIYFIQHIKSGKKLFIRKIAGLEAVDEAIGRATEMGKPILYIPGILDMNDVQTMASMSILGRVARTVAEYDTRLMVPTSKSLVMTTGREVVKEAYISIGRPDAFSEDIVTYLTDEQFGYVAGVNGIMVREKPATILYLGAFFAESLIMAETGNAVGAIQIAGTAQPAQLPFFIAACDYTLIGEELFAASAYLSHDPKQLGSLKGQDIGKVLGMAGIVLGSLFLTIGELSGAGWAKATTRFIYDLFRAATS